MRQPTNHPCFKKACFRKAYGRKPYVGKAYVGKACSRSAGGKGTWGKKALALLTALALLLPSGTGITPRTGKAAEAQSGFLDLDQQQIVQEMGAGWNLGNQFEANDGNGNPKEDAWTGVTVTERMIRTVSRAGFQSIRIPVSYLNLIGDAPDYAIQTDWLDRVQQVVDWAIQYDLYVILNIHGDGYSNIKGGWILPGADEQEPILEKFKAVWTQIAERYKNYDHHIIFESMNEIGANIAEMNESAAKDAAIQNAYTNINAYNQTFVDAVRQTGGNNSRRWLLVPGLNTNITYTAGDYGFAIPEDSHRSADIPAGEKRLMVSVHYYDPWAFCGQEDYNATQWGEDGDISKKVGYGQEDEMEAQFTQLKNAFTSQGYPVIIGEYGSIDKTTKNNSGVGKAGDPDPDNNRFRADYAATLCSLAVQNGCVPVYWDNGWNGDFGFGLFDRSTYKTTQPEILAAIMNSYGQADSGKATAITLDKKIMVLDLVDGRQALQATLTPADAGDSIQWESSDPSVASVSYKGNVTPKGSGVCLITATVPGGASAACIVKVKEAAGFKAGLFAQNAADWNTLECDNYLEIGEDGGGTFTISLSGSKEQMSALATLFIKDVSVQRGVSETSALESALFTVDSLQFNGHDCAMSTKTFAYQEGDATDDSGKPTGKRTVPDICMLNYWYEPANCITDLKKNSASNSGCSFPSTYYVTGTNTLTMQVTVTNAVLKKDYVPSEDTEVQGLALSQSDIHLKAGDKTALTAAKTPADATEKILWFSENPKIAAVAQDGTVTGVKTGKTTVHALTFSGQDVRCSVTVDSSTGQGNKTGSGNRPTTEGKDKALKKGAVFTAGKLKYKVTKATGAKAAVTVKAAKNKKAKSIAIPASVKKNGVTYAVTAIGANAFKNSKKLAKVTLGKNITYVGKNAFRGAGKLKRITVKTAKLKKVGKNALKGIHSKAVIKVPKKKKKAYRKLWKNKGQKKTVKIK